MKIKIDDYNINYIDEGSGTTILLIHGWGSNLNCFNELTNLLKTKYRVLAIDLLGFGESGELLKGFTVSDYVDIIIKFLDTLDIKNVILIGHSYGGRIIIKLNSRENLNFNIIKNVLIDAAGIKDRRDIKTIIKIKIYKISKFIINIMPISKYKKIILIDKLKNKFGSNDYKNSNEYLRKTLINSVNEDLTKYLENMRETLLIWGRDDTATPLYMAKIMEKKIKNSGLVILNGGHFSFIDDRYTFIKVIESYFKL